MTDVLDLARGAVRRVDFGYFVRPESETGTGSSRVEPCLGYVVRAGDAVLLVDTGMGTHPEVDAHYRPRRRSLAEALAPHGLAPTDVTHVTNCHLHFDHCGGNPSLAGRPVFVQRTELATARTTEDYTLPELLDGSGFVEVDGETEVLSDVLVMPTPGHTDGHQSFVVRLADGSVVVAGQSHDTTTAYAADVLALRAHRDGHPPPLPGPRGPWLARLQELDPRMVVFAHDHSVWVP
ncbi:MAG: MBL fold metallo-hydrolase [Lapillicoccus sp.]